MLKPKPAFTIVELLIVIVVIGILAAIIIVSYIGITNSATNSQVQANATEIAQKIQLFKSTRTDYPDTYPSGTNHSGTIDTLKSAVQLPATVNITQYLTDPSNSNYCATVQNTNGSGQPVSYSVSSTSPQPMSGVCVENLVANPGSEAVPFAKTGTGVNDSGATNILTSSPVATGSYATHFVTLGVSGNTFGYQIGASSITSSTTYAVSLYLYVESGSSVCLSVSASDYSTNHITAGGCTSAASWVRPSLIYTTTPSQTNLIMYSVTSSAQTLDVDAAMVTKGSTLYLYGDGNYPGWFWTGTPNNSTSIGPAVAQ